MDVQSIKTIQEHGPRMNRLMELLQEEHRKLIHENELLKTQISSNHVARARSSAHVASEASETEQGVDRAPVAPERALEASQAYSASKYNALAGSLANEAAEEESATRAADPKVLDVQVRKPLARGASTSSEVSARNRSKKDAQSRVLAGFKYMETSAASIFGKDAGGSEATRSEVARQMEVIRNKGKVAKKGAFGFKGAKALKARLKFVRQLNFDYFIAFLIIANAIYIGIETSMSLKYMVNNKSNTGSAGEQSRAWLVGDCLFSLIFLMEIFLRIGAYQVKFFTGSQQWWNAFDVVCVSCSITATFFDLIGVGDNFVLNFFKVLRLARLIRSLKISKSKLFHNLKTLSYTVAGSANAFVSAIVLLMSFMYLFGIMFMQGLQEYLKSDNADPSAEQELIELFGDTSSTVYTLLTCITGGENWKIVADQLKSVGSAYVVFFCIYVAFTLLCVLNILNGVFVNAAIESAQTNKELAIDTATFKRKALIEQMITWFVEADKDMSNKVSWDELHNLMRDDAVRLFFQANGLDVSSAAQIFLLLDKDGTGELEPEEFVDNFIQLQGGAKSVDLAALRVLCDDIHERLVSIEAAAGGMSAMPTTGATSHSLQLADQPDLAERPAGASRRAEELTAAI